MASRHKLSGFEFWRTTLQGARLVVAPMVDQSELAWRMLSRRYGAELCYTPMFHARMFGAQESYRKENFTTCPEDRPLIVQFCANNPETLLRAARYVEDKCDAVDLNLGCPQTIAKRGHYGAFLQDDWDLIASMVSLLHRELSVPVTCKIRIFKDIKKTVQYAKMLEKAGCQLLTVHGRLREQKGPQSGLASWDHIKAIKENLSIPVFANGNIQYLPDVEQCMAITGVDGVMSAEGNLRNPTIFTGEHPPCWRMAEEYLELAKTYPCPLSSVRGHLFKLWIHVLSRPQYAVFNDKFGGAKSVEQLEHLSHELKSLVMSNVSPEELAASLDTTNIPFWRCQPYIRPSSVHSSPRSRPVAFSEAELAARRLKRKKDRQTFKQNKKGRKWVPCIDCKVNSQGLKCIHMLCKVCCKTKCKSELVECPGHKLFLYLKSSCQQHEEQQQQSPQIDSSLSTEQSVTN